MEVAINLKREQMKIIIKNNAHARICPEWDAQTSVGFWDTDGSPNLDQTTRSRDSQQKRKREPAK